MPEEKTASTTQSAPASGQGSAPEAKTQGDTGGQVDTAQKQPVKEAPKKGVEVEFFKLRQAKRDLQSENASLSSRLEALERAQSKRSESVDAETSGDDAGFDDDALARRIQKKVEQNLLLQQAKYQLEADTHEADKWLRSRSHIQEDPNAALEIGRLLAVNPRYARLQQSDPIAAGKAAYLDWCEEKGVDPDLGRKKEQSAFASSGVRPTGAGAGQDSRQITDTDFRASLQGLRPGTPEWEAKKAEMVRAAKEGRYKGKVISFKP